MEGASFFTHLNLPFQKVLFVFLDKATSRIKSFLITYMAPSIIGIVVHDSPFLTVCLFLNEGISPVKSK